MALERWVHRERRTGRLVRACYQRLAAAGAIDADRLHALCRLTWITKASGDVADNTRAVVAPALSTILGLDLAASDPASLGREVRRLGAGDDIARLASRPIGFVNFYAAFRNSSRKWIGSNLRALREIFEKVVNASGDDDVLDAYTRVAALRPLPRANAGDLPAYNLVTPVLACLDARERAPIINSREGVQRRLARLGLSNATLIDQYLGLRGLIGQAGIDGAFALDTAGDEVVERAIAAAASTRRARRTAATTKPLGARSDEDLEYLRAADAVRVRKVHNQMTNALRSICQRARLTVEEGTDSACMFDALVREYAGTERHLLIEVKTDSAPALCRMAVGQLLDYRRLLPDRAAIDLAVLLPRRPPKDAMAFFGDVGVAVVWFNEGMSRIEGQVALRRTG